MRRHHDKAHKVKKFMVYFMAILMVGSLFGIVFLGFRSGGSSSGSFKYNDFKFINRGNLWSTTVDGRGALFTYFPADVELIPVENVVTGILKNKALVTVVYLALTVIVGYYLFSSLSIVQVAAGMLFTSLLMVISFIPYSEKLFHILKNWPG